MDLTKVLESTISADKDELEAAQKFLEAAAQTNLPQFLVALAMELADPAKSQVARMAAGLQLKNNLTSKDNNVKMQLQRRWMNLDDSVKLHIKTLTLQTLGTETSQPSIAPQCIAAIAAGELPNGQWQELIHLLVQNVTSPSSTEAVKQQTLEALGYICQDIAPQYLAANSNEILTAIVQGMRKEERSDKVRFAATTALLNSLEFTKANFENDNERHFIMQVVCEATQSEEAKVKTAALQNLVKIMSLYYHHMETYMAPALFAITLDAMRSAKDEVCLQGIEFWSTVCDEEMDLAIEAAEAAEQGKSPERVSKFYAKGALEHLIEIILLTLTKQEEFDDEDDWNPCKAAGVCLMLFAQCCENDILKWVLPFVKANIKNADWRFRDAAVMAFGSILEGPEPKELEPIVAQAMPVLIELMKDESVVVRDTVAWTLGRVCELIPQAAINDAYLIKLLEAMMEGLDAEPRVAANVCWAFSSLGEAAYEGAPVPDEEVEPATYCLSSLFPQIVKKTLDTTNRPDASQANLRSAAYEAVMELIKNSPKDCYEIVQSTTLLILERLQQVLHMDSVSSDRAQYNDLQSLLCATLQSVLRKVRPEDAKQIADPVMASLLLMFNTSPKQLAEGEEQGSGVQEDAFMAVGTLVEVVGEDFIKYMVAFKPILIEGLKNHAEHQVCSAAVGLVGDVCRSLAGNVLPFADEFMQHLLENLADNNVHRTVKPQILSVFGDMALAIGTNFTKYLEMVLGTLLQASQAQVDKNDYDMVDYLNELREGCLEAYTGIVQGLKGDAESPNPEVSLLQPHVMNITAFIEVCAEDPDHTDSIVTCACGLAGDLCAAFGSSIQPLLDKPVINELLSEGRRSKTHKTKSLALWATKELRKLKQMN